MAEVYMELLLIQMTTVDLIASKFIGQIPMGLNLHILIQLDITELMDLLRVPPMI